MAKIAKVSEAASFGTNVTSGVPNQVKAFSRFASGAVR